MAFPFHHFLTFCNVLHLFQLMVGFLGSFSQLVVCSLLLLQRLPSFVHVPRLQTPQNYRSCQICHLDLGHLSSGSEALLLQHYSWNFDYNWNQSWINYTPWSSWINCSSCQTTQHLFLTILVTYHPLIMATLADTVVIGTSTVIEHQTAEMTVNLYHHLSPIWKRILGVFIDHHCSVSVQLSISWYWIDPSCYHQGLLLEKSLLMLVDILARQLIVVY